MADALGHDLTDAVYRAALEPEAWQDVMQLMRHRFPSEAQTFYLLHLEPRRVRPISLAGVGDPWLKAFDELYFAPDNPWLQCTQKLHRPGIVRTNERLDEFLRDRGALYRSSYYNDWMRPQGFRYTIGSTLLSERGIVANVTLLRSPEMRPFDASEVHAFERINRHMTRALQMSMRLGDLQAHPANAAAFDAIPQAVAIIDASRKLLHANPAMEALLARHRGLRIVHGAVEATDPAVRRLFDAQVAAATSFADRPVLDAAPLSLRSPGSPGLDLQVVPLSGPLARGLVSRPTLMLVATEREPATALSPESVRERYGCTASESRLVCLLAQGMNLRESAERIGITYGSARIYLKLVFEKLGVHTQAQLVARVLQDTAGPVTTRPQ